VAAGQRQEALDEYRGNLAFVEKLAAADPNNTQWQVALVLSLYNVSTMSEPPQARTAIRRAITIGDALARADALTAVQRKWPDALRPDALREMLAKLPPEQADAKPAQAEPK
jgi:hypothetical protein